MASRWANRSKTSDCSAAGILTIVVTCSTMRRPSAQARVVTIVPGTVCAGVGQQVGHHLSATVPHRGMTTGSGQVERPLVIWSGSASVADASTASCDMSTGHLPAAPIEPRQQQQVLDET